jgi:phosphoglycerate kinase
MKTLDTFDFAGKKALIRVDFNVPLNDAFEVTDDTRIRAAMPTIRKILKDKGSVILMSHLGRPKNGPADKYSLRHIQKTVSELLGTNVHFSADCIGAEAEQKAKALQPGEVLLLENLRFHKEEEGGDEAFAKQLALLGDYYVNDAFGTAHRAHASTAIIARFFKGRSCFGYLMANELASIDKVLNNSERPFTAILGGAKVSDKILILQQLLAKANNIIIGGGMAFTFLKALGGKIGNSLVENERLETALKILDEAKKKGVNLYIPVDSVAAQSFSNDGPVQTFGKEGIADGWMGLDIGPETEKLYADVIARSRTGTYSLVGGGDSVAAINKYKLASEVSYVSTGGGALLEYMESGTLPGVSAILEG